MKKLIILLFVFIACNSNAQWYTRQFGVDSINQLNKEQLNIAFTKAEKIANTGKVLIIVGVPTFIVGGVIVLGALGEEIVRIITFSPDHSWSAGDTGAVIACIGAVSTLVGIPLGLTGNERKSSITLQLAKFNDTSYIPSIGIRITF
jgi:hypothetical protein